MERLLVLRLEAVGCNAEALLNGVPLARVDAARPSRTLPVHEFTLAGANALELVVQPALPGAPEVIAPQLSDGTAWAGVRLLLPRAGQVAHPSNARTLAQIDWAAPEGELYEAPLLNTLLPLMTSFSLPVVAELEPLAADDGALLQAAGAATGALVGEAGLRPRTSGGSGWEWFARLRLEPVTLPVLVSDPFLGESVQTLALLPAMQLIDWSLG